MKQVFNERSSNETFNGLKSKVVVHFIDIGEIVDIIFMKLNKYCNNGRGDNQDENVVLKNWYLSTVIRFY